MNQELYTGLTVLVTKTKPNFQDLQVKLGGPIIYCNLKNSSMSFTSFFSSFLKSPSVSIGKEVGKCCSKFSAVVEIFEIPPFIFEQ